MIDRRKSGSRLLAVGTHSTRSRAIAPLIAVDYDRGAMADLLRCRDRWGRTVTLDEDRWIDHVLRRRPYFRGQERACVEETLSDPEFVTLDVDDPTRRCFYRPSPLPPPHANVLVKVVVAYRPVGDGGPETGTVVTVFPKPKSGERRIWP